MLAPEGRLPVNIRNPDKQTVQVGFTARHEGKVTEVYHSRLTFTVATLKVVLSPNAYYVQYMSRPMGKPTLCIGENKDADQLRGNREADQRLCFRYTDSTVPLLLKSEFSRF